MTAGRPWDDPRHNVRADLERARELVQAPYEPSYYPCPWCPPRVQWRADALMWHVKEAHPDGWAELLESFNSVARGPRAVAAHLEERHRHADPQ